MPNHRVRVSNVCRCSLVQWFKWGFVYDGAVQMLQTQALEEEVTRGGGLIND